MYYEEDEKNQKILVDYGILAETSVLTPIPRNTPLENPTLYDVFRLEACFSDSSSSSAVDQLRTGRRRLQGSRMRVRGIMTFSLFQKNPPPRPLYSVIASVHTLHASLKNHTSVTLGLDSKKSTRVSSRTQSTPCLLPPPRSFSHR